MSQESKTTKHKFPKEDFIDGIFISLPKKPTGTKRSKRSQTSIVFIIKYEAQNWITWPCNKTGKKVSFYSL